MAYKRCHQPWSPISNPYILERRTGLRRTLFRTEMGASTRGITFGSVSRVSRSRLPRTSLGGGQPRTLPNGDHFPLPSAGLRVAISCRNDVAKTDGLRAISEPVRCYKLDFQTRAPNSTRTFVLQPTERQLAVVTNSLPDPKYSFRSLKTGQLGDETRFTLLGILAAGLDSTMTP